MGNALFIRRKCPLDRSSRDRSSVRQSSTTIVETGYREEPMRRTDLSVLLAALMLSSSAHAETIKEQQQYLKGCWGAYNGPWSTYGGPLKAGVDFGDLTNINEAIFPNGTSMSWYFPKTPPTNAGVYGYNAITFGDFSNGPIANCIPAKQLKDIKELALHYSVSWTSSAGDFNVLSEMYAYTKPSSASSYVAEIGFLPKQSATGVAYAKAGKSLGTFGAWTVYQQGKYYMFTGGGAATGDLDFLGAANFLKSKGVLTGDEWFTGLGFGVEPIFGGGYLSVSTMAVTYQ
jgi:hypothetical protein